MADLTVADVMERAVGGAVFLEPRRLISSSGHNLPVPENGRPVGAVTRVDCLEALSRGA